MFSSIMSMFRDKAGQGQGQAAGASKLDDLTEENMSDRQIGLGDMYNKFKNNEGSTSLEGYKELREGQEKRAKMQQFAEQSMSRAPQAQQAQAPQVGMPQLQGGGVQQMPQANMFRPVELEDPYQNGLMG